jgi:protein disulfide-isomerase A6
MPDLRNEYLSMLTKMGDKFKKQGWGWLWSEGTAQPELEEVNF